MGRLRPDREDPAAVGVGYGRALRTERSCRVAAAGSRLPPCGGGGERSEPEGVFPHTPPTAICDMIDAFRRRIERGEAPPPGASRRPPPRGGGGELVAPARRQH